MKVSSTQEDDWSIISSSSDVDDELTSSDAQQNDLEGVNEFPDQPVSSFDQGAENGFGGVSALNWDNCGNGNSTHTIKPKSMANEATPKDSGIKLDDLRIGGKSFILCSNESLTRKSGVVCKSLFVSQKACPLFQKYGSSVMVAFSKFDSTARYVSAAGFDWSFGSLLVYLRECHHSYEARKDGPESPTKKFSNDLLKVSIATLDYLTVLREVWLYYLAILSVAALSIPKLQNKPSNKPTYSPYFQYPKFGEAWKQVYDNAFYENGPLHRNWFGFMTRGPKRLKFSRYFNNLNELKKQYFSPFLEKSKKYASSLKPLLSTAADKTTQLLSKIPLDDWTHQWNRVKVSSVDFSKIAIAKINETFSSGFRAASISAYKNGLKAQKYASFLYSWTSIKARASVKDAWLLFSSKLGEWSVASKILGANIAASIRSNFSAVMRQALGE